MQDLAFLRHVTIGQYLPGKSLVHRLDPRVKITIVLLLTVAMISTTSYLANVLLLALCLALIGLARLPLGYVLGTVRPAVPVLVVLAIFQLLFLGETTLSTSFPNRVLYEWGVIVVSTNGIQLAFVLWARFLILTMLAGLVTSTTPMSYLTHGLEDMLHPFTYVGLPAHEISLIGTIALRFVPILGEELETIMKAQASRGANLAMGGRLHFIRTTRAILVLIVPLFLDAFRRAEELVVAMEARCYTGGRGRTRLTQLQMTGMDRVFLVAFGLLSVGVIVFRTRFPL